MTYETLLYEVSGSIARITMNRVPTFNALNRTLLLELTRAVEAAGADPAVRVLILTGTGDKAFSSGADLKEGIGEAKSMGQALEETYNPLILAMRAIPKPVIARINGVAAGAGCSLALACDIRLAVDTASLSLLFVKIGLVPDAGASFFLPRLVGPARAFELASTGRSVPAPEALHLGLVDAIYPPTDFDAAVDALAARYAQGPTAAIGALKRLIHESAGNSLQEQLALETELQNKAGFSHDAAEGIRAFLEKRPPRFEGR